ncbi:hypothetical protein I552_9301 [Mycobacterium xenopi 3993]|nr:hypothetical protein I552_9301 [Mycobacterium xenopi 3993]
MAARQELAGDLPAVRRRRPSRSPRVRPRRRPGMPGGRDQ